MKYLNILLFLNIICFGFAQQTDYVDFKTVKAELYIDLNKEEVIGSVKYKFDILKEVDSIKLDAKNIDFDYLEVNGIEHLINLSNMDKFNGVIKGVMKPSRDNVLELKYHVKPQKALYFIQKDNEKQVWTQGQGKYTSNWLPSFDDMNEKVEFDLSIVADDEYKVIVNGKLLKTETDGGYTIWHYDMQKPMSSYLVALVIGKYNKKVEFSKRGVPLEMYYYPEDSLKVEPTYRYTKQMFDFLEDEIGVPYPWQNYKQVPVKDFLYAGMENTSTTIFSDAFVVDSTAFVDKNYVNVNAHELAHQWFGDLVTEVSGTHHWLQEGFATYYALLAERDVFGDNYYYWRLYEYAQELLDQDRLGGGTALLNPKSSSATFYKKGAWVLHMLREKVGDEAFKIAVKNYLQKHQFKNVETTDFINEIKKSSGQDLTAFVESWLKKDVFLYDDALTSLKKSVFIQEYLMVDCEVYTSKCKDYVSSWVSDEAKTKIVSQIPDRLTRGDFKNSLKARQAIAQNLKNVPLELKGVYETLLGDKSYITIESALINLWKSFPKERSKYLKKTNDIQGFNDKNVRILWLTLALLTDDFEPENNQKYYDELRNYTNPEYGFEIRQNAFQYLKSIQACDDICNENLKQATKHHNWRFSKFAKELLKQ